MPVMRVSFLVVIFAWILLPPVCSADSSAAAPAQLPAPPASPAEDPSEHHEITPSCRAEVKQYCHGILPGGGRIKKCIEANENKLSPPCRKAVQERLEQEGAKKP